MKLGPLLTLGWPTLVLAGNRYFNNFHELDTNQDEYLSSSELEAATNTVVYTTQSRYRCEFSDEWCLQGSFDVVASCANQNGGQYFFGSREKLECLLHTPVLAHSVPWILDTFFTIKESAPTVDEYPADLRARMICETHAKVCGAGEVSATGWFGQTPQQEEACREQFGGCKRALRHLVAMVFKEDINQQQCMFHDYLSTEVDGSILFEMDEPMNHGLCRWAQYINVLADETRCSPAAIITMAGLVGMESCGNTVWHDAGQIIPVNRPFDCDSTNGNRGNPGFWNADGHRRPEHDDVLVSSNSTHFERFWCALNWHPASYPSFEGDRDPTNGNSRYLMGDANPADDPTVSDCEVQYSTQLTASTHIIGRVTCPVTGQSSTFHNSASEANLSHPGMFAHPGFFHKPRGKIVRELPDRTRDVRSSLIGIDGLRARVAEGFERMRDMQCTDTAPDLPQSPELGTTWKGLSPAEWQEQNGSPGSKTNGFRGIARYTNTGGLRNVTVPTAAEDWGVMHGETALNSVSGACDMPTFAFWGRTIIVGFPQQAIRALWGIAFQSYRWQDGERGVPFTNSEVCQRSLSMHIPSELAAIADVPLPTSPALQRFLDIAYDGVDTISSAWDSCDPAINRCTDLGLAGNRICTQGQGTGLRDFEWNDWTPEAARYDPPLSFGWTKFMHPRAAFVDCKADPSKCMTVGPPTPAAPTASLAPSSATSPTVEYPSASPNTPSAVASVAPTASPSTPLSSAPNTVGKLPTASPNAPRSSATPTIVGKPTYRWEKERSTNHSPPLVLPGILFQLIVGLMKIYMLF